MIRKREQRENLRQEACDSLKARIRPGDTIYTYYAHVSSSGATHVIRVAIVEDGKISRIDGLVAMALVRTWSDRHGGIVAYGVGFDPGYMLVAQIARNLFDDENALNHVSL